MSTVSSDAYYVKSDGSESQDRSDATGIDEITLSNLISRYSNRIPIGYFLGVAARESGKSGDLYIANEHDIDTQDDGSTYDSWGLFQMGRTEALLAHVIPTTEQMIDPENNVRCAAYTFERNLDKILAAAGIDSPSGDIWYYLAWAHNAGVNQPVTSIKSYGMDWQALKSRPQNEYVTGSLVPYAEFIYQEAERVPTIGTGDLNSVRTENGVLGIILGAGALWLLGRLAGA